MRFRPALLLLPLSLLPANADDSPRAARDQVRALEQYARKVIDAAEPSVVAVVASHLQYPAAGAGKKLPGQLGRYHPPRRETGLAAPPAVARLDLSDAQYAGDHQFGSGLVLDARPDDPAGPLPLILTNFHLIDGATKIYVRASSGKGSYADILAADARSDLAVLKVLDPLPGLTPVRFAAVRVADGPGDERATVYRGMSVIALGHPLAAGFADGNASASWGMLSNVRRRATGPPREDVELRYHRGLYHYGCLLQTDARITLGSSGGGLFDLDGKLIGMTAPLAAVTGSDTAGGFAVPFDQNYRRIVRKLQEGREVEYGFLGVQAGEPVARGGVGLWVERVTPGSPAAVAGLVGRDNSPDGADAILAVDGQPVRDPDDLFLHIGAALAGSKVRLTLLRNGRERDLDVPLAKLWHKMASIASKQPDPVFGLRVEYPSVSFLKNQTVNGSIPPGVEVRDVEPRSPAAAKFPIQPDGTPRAVITHVNGKAVSTPDEFYAAAEGKRPVVLRVADLGSHGPERTREVTLP